jgi:hypothetical protein
MMRVPFTYIYEYTPQFVPTKKPSIAGELSHYYVLFRMAARH